MSKYLNLEKPSIVFLTSNYEIGLTGYAHFPSYDQVESSMSLFKKIKNFNYPNAYDRYIRGITGGEEYTAYIDLMSVGNRVLITNPKCKAYHFIEEGIVNYGNYDSLTLFTIDNQIFPWRVDFWKDRKLIVNGLLRILRGRSVKMLSLPIHPNCYAFVRDVKFYCFSDEAFKNIPFAKKVVVPFEAIKEEMLKLSNKLDISDSSLWIGDAMNRVYGINLDSFESTLKIFLKKMLSAKHLTTNKVFIKFRPDQSDDEKKVTLDVFQSLNFHTELLSYQTILEALLIVSKNVTVIGNGSSLLIYGHILHHKSYTLFNLLPDTDHIPLKHEYPRFWQMVKTVE